MEMIKERERKKIVIFDDYNNPPIHEISITTSQLISLYNIFFHCFSHYFFFTTNFFFFFHISNMSNSENFHIKDAKEELSKNLKIPTLMIEYQEKEDDKKEEQSILFSKQDTTTSSSTKQQQKVEEKEEEENDGFKTPTHFDYRIQEAKQCPQAPRKPKSSLKRRKLPQCKHLIDVEVELLFQIQHKTLSSSQQCTKKVRRE